MRSLGTGLMLDSRSFSRMTSLILLERNQPDLMGSSEELSRIISITSGK